MNEKDILLINHFMEGSLSEEEKLAFNKKMDLEEDFKEQVQFEIQLNQSLDESQWSFVEDVNNEQVLEYKKLLSEPKTIELKEILKSIVEEKSISKRKNFSVWYGIAAILLVGFSLFSIFNNKNNEELYAQYLNNSEIPSLAVRSANENPLANIQQLFQEEKYSETLNLISDSLVTNSQSGGTLMIIKGVSFLETNRNEEARKTFDELINSDLLDAPKGYWYKALSYLKIGEIDKCKSLLEEIIKNNFYNSEKAIKLLNDLS